MAYEQIITVSGSASSGQIPQADGNGGYTWATPAAGVSPSSATPLMDGTAAVGTSNAYARGDHRHPTDTSRAPLASPALTGTPTAPTATAGTNTTQIATTAFVDTAVDNASGTIVTVNVPVSAWNNGSATVTCTGVTATSNIVVTSDPSTYAVAAEAGVYCSAQGANSLTFSSLNGTPSGNITMNVWIGTYVVETLTYAPLASPAFTGTPTAPTATSGTSTTQIATTQFVDNAIDSINLADLGAVSTDDVKWKIYDTVEDIGLTVGSATISSVLTAMVNKTILIAPANHFASTEVPSVYGYVEIVRYDITKVSIEFHGKESPNGIWYMFITSTGVPTGRWIRHPFILKVEFGNISSLPATVSDVAISNSMEVIHSYLSNPSAQSGDWTVSTSNNGSVTISGSISGTTSVTLYLSDVL